MLHNMLRAAAGRDLELIENGEFDDDANGWILFSIQTVEIVSTSGEARITVEDNPSGAYQQIETEPGETYTVSADIRVGTAPSVEVRAYDSFTSSPNLLASSISVTSFTATFVTFNFTAVDTTSEIYLRVVANSSTQRTGFFDNVSAIRA